MRSAYRNRRIGCISSSTAHVSKPQGGKGKRDSQFIGVNVDLPMEKILSNHTQSTKKLESKSRSNPWNISMDQVASKMKMKSDGQSQANQSYTQMD